MFCRRSSRVLQAGGGRICLLSRTFTKEIFRPRFIKQAIEPQTQGTWVWFRILMLAVCPYPRLGRQFYGILDIS